MRANGLRLRLPDALPTHLGAAVGFERGQATIQIVDQRRLELRLDRLLAHDAQIGESMP